MVDAAAQGVSCHWARPTARRPCTTCLSGPSTAPPGRAIYRTPLNGRRSFLDTDVAAGQTIRYAVVALAADGRVVGIGRPDTVLVPTSPPERRSPAIACERLGTLAQVDGRRMRRDERALVERARADPAAFAELYRRYLPRVHAFAYRRTGAVEVAEDITSAAFERALRNLHVFRWQPGGFGPWLFRIVSNELADHYRRTGRAASARAAGAARRSSRGAA